MGNKRRQNILSTSDRIMLPAFSFSANLMPVRAGVETGLAKHETQHTLSEPLRRIQKWIRVCRFASLFNPERHFFANWLASRLVRPLLTAPVGVWSTPLRESSLSRPDGVAMCEGNRIPIGGVEQVKTNSLEPIQNSRRAAVFSFNLSLFVGFFSFLSFSFGCG